MPNIARPPSKPDDAVLYFKIDDAQYVIRLKEVSGNDAKAFRAGVGMTIRKAIHPFTEEGDAAEVDLDIVAGLIFLARRQRGEKNLRYETVAEQLTYANDFEFGRPDEDGDPPPDEEIDPGNFAG